MSTLTCHHETKCECGQNVMSAKAANSTVMLVTRSLHECVIGYLLGILLNGMKMILFPHTTI